MATLALNLPLKFLRFDSLITRSFLQQATILIHCPENGVHYNLPTRVKGIYFYLYLFMDIFSRKIVGWQIYDVESSDLTGDVMRDIYAREAILPNQVVLHSDNGSPMKGATMLATLQAGCRALV